MPLCLFASSDIGYIGKKVNGKWFHAVIANMNSENVKATAIINAKKGQSENIWKMISRSQPTVAISGTFFDIRTSRPIGSIVVEGLGVWDGFHGSCLAVDFFNQASILNPKHGEKINFDLYRFLLRGGVRLLTDGRFTCDPKSQKFKDPRVWSSARRVAIGVSSFNKLVLIATDANTTLTELAGAMKAFGAKDAMALDGGTSAAMYYKGKLLVKPGRKLTNLIALYEAPMAAWQTLPTTGQ